MYVILSSVLGVWRKDKTLKQGPWRKFSGRGETEKARSQMMHNLHQVGNRGPVSAIVKGKSKRRKAAREPLPNSAQ